jgi:hypothetical protein
METPEEGSTSGTARQDDLETMMRDLGLREDDLDDVVFEEGDSAEVDNRWLLIVPVHMGREFSNFWFFKNMRAALDLAQDVKIRTLSDNLFTIKFPCLGD